MSRGRCGRGMAGVWLEGVVARGRCGRGVARGCVVGCV